MRKHSFFPLLLTLLLLGCAGGGGRESNPPPAAGPTKWTVMVFLNAANDLHLFSNLNVDQMERVAGNPQVKFVVQWKQANGTAPNFTYGDTRRLLISPNTSGGVQSPTVQNLGSGVDMGRPETLREFVSWAKANYPAERYALVVWNHGNGWRRSRDMMTSRGVSYDDETSNAIQTWQLAQAVGDTPFEFIAWDASLMQMIEVAYELEGRTKYIVGSEESPPGAGYPYDAIFRLFRDEPDAPTPTLTKSFVDGMLGVPAYQREEITQSVVDVARLPSLATAVDGLGRALIDNRAAVSSLVRTVRTESQGYGLSKGERYYRDLIDVCARLEAGGAPQPVAVAAAAVRSAAAQAVIWEGHNGNSPGSRGLAIDFSPSSNHAPPSTLGIDYARLRFAQGTSWDEWLLVAP